MKFSILLFVLFYSVYSYADTLYVYKRSGQLVKIPTKEIDSITFAEGPKVTDIAGYSYPTVTIGTQTWMAENLRTHLYNDGTPILKELDIDLLPQYFNSGAYTWYNLDSTAYSPNYGTLYNGFVAIQTTKNVCPIGWRVPSQTDINTLQTTLAALAPGNEGGALKDNLLLFWTPPNSGAINSSGFAALPSGFFNGAIFEGVNNKASFWSSTPSAMAPSALTFSVEYNTATFSQTFRIRNYYLPIRCIKN
ncbi:MAG: fibrobacter succinogenes major paralogous domain-containing protein [Cytophagaceae bacterium]|jgi:uncharacterized protein (TIGR02145 family)|nr:fibrobacter succinogenes major paralogous domain-containing protein [Cytophagaceae bacterium]